MMDKATWVRTIVLLLALINQFLIAFNLHPIPGSQERWGEVISLLFTAVASGWAWFKNNYVTVKGKQQQQVLKQSKLIS